MLKSAIPNSDTGNMSYAWSERDSSRFIGHTLGAGVSTLTDALAENLSIGLILVDGEGFVRFLNHKAEKMLQVNREEVVGKQVYMLPLRTAVYKVLSENCRDYPVEMHICGQVIQAKATSVICREGACLGDMYELRNITMERREQRQSDEFVAAMTHDLKSPLTVMLGYVDALVYDPVCAGSAKAAACLDEMRRSGHRLLGMIEDILDSYRLDAGLLQIQRDFCDLKAVLERSCSELGRDAEAHEIAFSSSIDPAIPVFKADGKQLARVFSNIISNAIKFTPRHGSVKVEARYSGGEVQIAVSDSGIGISAKDQERIFNKYYRAEQAKGYKGTGLGLTISKAIAEEHGGSIQVASSEAAGSCFTVYLPATGAE